MLHDLNALTSASSVPFHQNGTTTLLHGHSLDVLKTLPADSVHCCVTSPPYWGLRDYGVKPSVWGGSSTCKHRWETHLRPTQNGLIDHNMSGETKNPHSATRRPLMSALCARCGAWKGCLGLEPPPELYVEHLVEVFREVKRALRADGTLWLNMGDCHAGSWGNYRSGAGLHQPESHKWSRRRLNSAYPGPDFLTPAAHAPGLKPKDLVGIPWLLAFALREDGWYLRSDIIWHKPNVMPESVRDRPTRAHEYLFLLSKSRRYYYDAEAIKEPLAQGTLKRLQQTTFDRQTGGRKDYGHARNINGNRSARQALVNLKNNTIGSDVPWAQVVATRRGPARSGDVPYPCASMQQRHGESLRIASGLRNKRSVWSVPTRPYLGAHFATYPPDLIRPCIRAGCPLGGVVLDPFMGSGTTGQVCLEEGRRFVGIELKAEYLELAQARLKQVDVSHSVTRGDVG